MPAEIHWHQYLIEFTDRDTGEHIITHELAPALNQAQLIGELHTWWYLRKTPAWRLRYQPSNPDTTVIDPLLADLTDRGHLTRWTQGIYEPETLAFGGHAAMDVAHTLFHHDSQHLLARADETEQTSPLGRREATVLLYGTMLRAAGLDWFEQGDVWAKVTDLRPGAQAQHAASQCSDGLSRAIRRLMTANPRSVPGLLPEPWLAAFETAGQQLTALARDGQLQRGLRAVLAHHFIFHANRAGVSGADQATLAALAVDTVFHTTPSQLVSAGSVTHATKVSAMTATVSDDSGASADELRARLADHLCRNDIVRTASIEDAFRRVPREAFLPGVPLEEAYADEPVYTKHDGTGTRISAASQPRIVAMMLEQLQLQPGHRVLEIGAGTGYNGRPDGHHRR